MPSCNFTQISNHNTQLLWHITEPEEVLLEMSNLSHREQIAHKKIAHPLKRKEWLAARLALKRLLNRSGYAYTDLQKDSWGRPYLLSTSTLYLSLAHSFPFAFAAINQHHPIGIDIQWPCKKLQNVKEKFLDYEEVKDSGKDLEKLCIYWCAKEAIYKAQGGKNLSLKQDIRISAFTKRDQGAVWGKSEGNLFVVYYNFYKGYVLVWGKCKETV